MGSGRCRGGGLGLGPALEDSGSGKASQLLDFSLWLAKTHGLAKLGLQPLVSLTVSPAARGGSGWVK
eukprot:CAMPEP_0204538650 /NCGR_PEP_ID=MMETSP0661-20131031/16165_1 /ASSEMBLY_ACC=CAM_ASM_000606 /TAXON_ID=109239 /ORGANISM="Alexandrium margalefi, Strain AMGDE01CS-322" /LENGTH=66 /DNA_ID=CAMNT_0051545241 /DNA_START=65 /DNA_END=262 /DNA_ORIENTATION=+